MIKTNDNLFFYESSSLLKHWRESNLVIPQVQDVEGLVESTEIVNIDKSKNIELLETPVGGLGIVVCRIKPEEKNWRVKAFGSAIKVNDQFVANYHKN